MAALPRMWRRRVSRRLATAAGVLAGSTLIGSSLAALNGSVLPFNEWPSSGHTGAAPSVLLPAPPQLARAPTRHAGLLAPLPVPSLASAGLTTAAGSHTGAAAPLRSGPGQRAAGHPTGRLVVRQPAAPHALVGAVAPVAIVQPAPAPSAPPAPAPAPAPATETAPAPAPGHGHGHRAKHQLASPAPAAPTTTATVASVNPSPGRAAHGKGLPPGQAKKLAAMASAPAPSASSAPAAAAPAQAAAPAPAPAAGDVPPGRQPGHGHGHGQG
jgi:hypothetical protein